MRALISSIHIENVAVIKNLNLDLSTGFNALTGETGAGKSIIIDSINFLLGNKSGREFIRTGEEKASVSAVFTDLSENVKNALAEFGVDFDETDGEIMLQRTITSEGRSGAKINGQSITGAVLREIGKNLINIHGQNDNQALMQKSSHIKILDLYAGNEEIINEYRTVYEKMLGVKESIKKLIIDENEKNRLSDMLAYQIKDIESVNPKQGEEEQLGLESEKLKNIEKITKNVKYSYRALKGSEKTTGAVTLLENTALALEQISGIIPEADEYAKKLTEYRYEIEDIGENVRNILAGYDGNPTARLDKIESRLDAISKLKKKYGQTVEEIIEFKNQAKEKLNAIEDADENISKLQKEYEALKKEALAAAKKLSESRKAAGEELKGKITEVLEFLDMPKVKFAVKIDQTADGNGEFSFDKNGIDDVEFLISANPGEPLLPMIKIASGGELSRIMLAVKSVISDKDGVDTIIFDEIDTGISGKTSRKVGIKLKQISKSVQVICVTHSAQIASAAGTHIFISKGEEDGRTQTKVKTLSYEERIAEIARIIGGINVSDTQRKAAEEMIEEGKSF